jgi:bifunctional enzyme CysN/CysC
MAPAPAADALARHRARDLLRFVTCGSVDDGKSTLLGRLLHDCGLLPDDQLEALAADSRRHGTQGERLDFALLLDGLSAEREQGITIDVAYRYFATARRSFIVADAPGHEQYTRNLVTGASRAELAVLLVDARKGLQTQTRRHAFLADLLGIRRLVLAVNKMDLVGYDRARFEDIVFDFLVFADQLSPGEITAIPVSALDGDNVVRRSEAMPWYEGPALVEHLEQVPAEAAAQAHGPLRLPVQWVCRTQDFRGYAGLVSEGAARPGDRVRILPSGRETGIGRIVGADGDRDGARAGESVMLTLADEVDCGRGDVIVGADAPLEVADQFQAALVWMDEEELLPGRSYLLKIGARTCGATVTEIEHQIDVNTLEARPAKTLALNAIGTVKLALDRRIPFASYAENRDLGGFILIDRQSHHTVGAGMIRFALRRSHNIHWQHLEIDRDAHAASKAQKPKVVWFTGLSGAGKSTIANLVEKKLHHMGRHTFLLDGDNVRHGLNRDLGFTDADRVENVRRVGEVARLMADAGLIVLCAFISPFRAERRMVREMMPEGEFVEVHVDAPLAEAEKRDTKGLYRKARAGEIANFTGIDSPYEVPERADIHIDTMRLTPEEAAELIVRELF